MRNKLEKIDNQLCTVFADGISLRGKLVWYPHGQCHVSILPNEHYYARVQFLPESIESLTDSPITNVNGYVIVIKESK